LHVVYFACSIFWYPYSCGYGCVPVYLQMEL
jgi:hypothetical protein